MTNKVEQSFLFHDRLTGLDENKVDINDAIPGRWLLSLGEGTVFLNSVSASNYDFLIPDSSGKWNVLSDSKDREEGIFPKSIIADDLEADSIHTISVLLSDLIDTDSTWHDWKTIVPLIPGINEDVDLHLLELEMIKNFGHLEVVCKKPRMHLHVEVERVPVSKAKRVPPQAVSYLASHTEDWDRPLIRGVMPKRILAEVRHDKFDIYENRVTARLVDNLIAYLIRRIRKLRKLLKVFQDKEDYSSEMAGTYQRHQRISKLWGQSIDANEGKKKVEETLHRLENLKYQIMGLLGSILYKEVPRRAYVPTTLKNTNIFTNDQQYSHIADLWREWASTGAEKVKSPKQFFDEGQQLCHGMNYFSMLLVIRALDSLGYQPKNRSIKKVLCYGSNLELICSGQVIHLKWLHDGVIHIEMDGRNLNILALPASLAFASNNQVAEILGHLGQSIENTEDGESLILYLGENDDSKAMDLSIRHALHTIGNDPRYKKSNIAFLPVSPWEIASTERIIRAIRWFISTQNYLSYPYKIAIPSNFPIKDIVKNNLRWLSFCEEKSTLEIRVPPKDHEWNQSGLQAYYDHFLQNCKNAEKRFKEIELELNKAGRNKKLIATLNRDKQLARNEVTECKKHLENIEKVIRELSNAKQQAESILICPTCGTKADSMNDFGVRGNDSFHCDCASCGTFWEIRICCNGHRYPVMLPSGDFFEVSEEQPGWVDRIYGGDVLSLPGKKKDGEWGFVCPDCGDIN